MSKRFTPPMVTGQKGKAPIVVLTAYTARVAELLDPHVDVLLVGDSLGMTIYGMPNTLGVTVEMMIAHGKAVAHAVQNALVVIDLPFGSYQASPAQAFETAARVMAETGAGAVKLEGGREMEETIKFLTERGIPVMAHVGLMPQHVQALGGYKMQGKTKESQSDLWLHAMAVQRAGAFAVVLECVEPAAAAKLTNELIIPTIGIGAGQQCDGQVLVIDDLIGLTARPPSFAKAKADAAGLIEKAVIQFAKETRRN